jgi:hypothetical protein
VKKSELRQIVREEIQALNEAYDFEGLDNTSDFKSIAKEIGQKAGMAPAPILNWLNKHYSVKEFNAVMEKQKGKREPAVFDYIKSSIMGKKKIK